MPRPFRFQPPSPTAGLLERPRLTDLLERRWNVRVVSVVAGPGFGKTSLLAAAWSRELPPRATQVWVACEPADESAERLGAVFAEALELPATSDRRVILDELWSRTPAQICIMLDDVHEIGPGSSGAAWLSEFVADMSSNVHVVLASRDLLPVPLARLAAMGQAIRVDESDLAFSDDEVAAIAARRGLAKADLDEAGGWPALVELTATTGGTVPAEFLWEEVLARMGVVRSELFARFGLCGGGDDEMVGALATTTMSIDELVAGVPLVIRSSDGRATVHPLWLPALRRLVSTGDMRVARLQAAAVHRRRGRYSSAMHLFAEAEAWDELFEVITEAEQRSMLGSSVVVAQEYQSALLPHEFGRWYRLLPPTRRSEPAAMLARGIAIQAADPLRAAEVFRRAAVGFRANGDAHGELAAISREGVIHWWRNDMVALLELYGRIGELIADGVERAETLGSVGSAAIAHLGGDSSAVLAALANVDDIDADRGWLPTVHWLRSVAYRRDGDLAKAHRELDRVDTDLRMSDPQMHIARLRIGWLEGDVERVAEQLHRHYDTVVATGDDFLVREAALEAAARAAWLGDCEAARTLLDAAPSLDEVVSPLASVLEAIARALICIEEGDEDGAASTLRTVVAEGPAALGTPGGWYWRDRAAMVVVRVLVPEIADRWESEALHGSHAVARSLTAAFLACRANDLAPVAELRWPLPGVVRAHLPRRWVAELVASAVLAGNPLGDDLGFLSERARSRVRSSGSDAGRPVTVSVLGTFSVQVAGSDLESPHLRRSRVRELLTYLAVFKRARREVIADDLWPDVSDPGHNLRVTLNYLNQVLEPDREPGQPSKYLFSTKEWLWLTTDGSIAVDWWQLEYHLDEADAAERAIDVSLALHHYASALPLWRGEALSDVSYSAWADPIRTAMRSRFIAAALRAGELWLGSGSVAESCRAGERALLADRYCEPAYRLMIRSHQAAGNPSAARETFQRCRAELLELGTVMDAATAALMTE